MYVCIWLRFWWPTIKQSIIGKSKQEWKRAIRSGNSVEKKADILNRRFSNFVMFISDDLHLNDKTWKHFVNDEEAYQQSLASRKVEYGKFVCKGDYQQWIKVIRLISSLFCDKQRSFKFEQSSGRQWKPQLVKFCSNAVYLLEIK